MPEWKLEIRKRLAGLRLSPAQESEIVEELAQHLDERYHELRRAGASEEEAYQTSLADLADDDQLKHDLGRIIRRGSPEPIVFAQRGRGRMTADIWQDLRYAVRMLKRTPGFTSIAVLCMALGIGGTTTIFSVVRPILLSRLPYKDPDRLTMIFTIWKFGNRSGDRGAVSGPDILEWRNRANSFEQIEAFTSDQVSLAGGAEAVRVKAAQVTPGLFGLLGISPQMGRVFSDTEQARDSTSDGTPGQVRPSVVMISSKLWRANFGADPEIVGRTVKLDGRLATIAGVMPSGYSFPLDADLWLPVSIPTTRGNAFLQVIARLKNGVTLDQARSEMAAIAHALHEEYPTSNNDLGLNTIPLRRYLVGNVQPILLVLF